MRGEESMDGGGGKGKEVRGERMGIGEDGGIKRRS